MHVIGRALIGFFLVFAASVQAKPLFIHVEGNTGCGKTTLLNLLTERWPSCGIVHESVEQWQDVKGQGNLLAQFFNEPTRWAFTFDTYAAVTQMERLRAPEYQTKEVVIVDRSIYCQYYCFSRLSMLLKASTPMEFEICRHILSILIDTAPTMPDGFVYIRTKPQTCVMRVQRRNRMEETGCPDEFLNVLHQCYEDWLIAKSNLRPELAQIPILILDGDLDYIDDAAIAEQHIEKIAAFIEDIRVRKNEC
jgi:deoxyadenosine/deoxycytidine kinase